MSEADSDDAPESYSADYVRQMRDEADRRVLAAELKSHALAAGLIDPADVRLFDLSDVKLGDDGALQLPDGFFEKARQVKPYLFAARNTASVAKPPSVAPMKARSVAEMSFDEWQAARSDLLRRS